jgi:hypothetical protein
MHDQLADTVMPGFREPQGLGFDIIPVEERHLYRDINEWRMLRVDTLKGTL